MSSLVEMKKKLNSHELEILRSELDRKRKSTGIAYTLWFFLSFFGIHKFYQGKFIIELKSYYRKSWRIV